MYGYKGGVKITFDEKFDELPSVIVSQKRRSKGT